MKAIRELGLKAKDSRRGLSVSVLKVSETLREDRFELQYDDNRYSERSFTFGIVLIQYTLICL